VNAGSLQKDLLATYGSPTPEALVASALQEVHILEDEGFGDIKISVKHSSPKVMIEAYRMLAEACDYPLHLGVTEAGPMPMGGVKSAVGIGTLLAEGIGDTIRVSLTDDPVEEVKVGNAILQSLGLRKRGLDLVACPSCGRAEIDVLALTKRVEAAIEKEKFGVPMRVAVMGCVVNGPGESKHADIGISLPGTFEEPVAPVFVDGVIVALHGGARALDRHGRQGPRLHPRFHLGAPGRDYDPGREDSAPWRAERGIAAHHPREFACAGNGDGRFQRGCCLPAHWRDAHHRALSEIRR